MQPSSTELDVLGVYQGDQNAFLRNVDSATGKKLMFGGSLGDGKDGTGTCHGEE